MARVACRWVPGSNFLPKDRASGRHARHSAASPAKKNNRSTRLPTPPPPPKRRRFAAVSSDAVANPTAPPTARGPRNSTAIPARRARGGPASPPTDATAGRTGRATARRGVFPPQDRPKVVVLATTKPADLGLPIAHGSLEDVAIHIVKEAHYRDRSARTGNRRRNANDLKPHRGTHGLHRDDLDFEPKALEIARL